MNILYHHRTMGRGAEGAHIANMVHAFNRLGHNVYVVSPPGVDPMREIGKKPLDKSDEKTSGITSIWKFVSRHCPQIIFEFLEIAYNFSSVFTLIKLLKKNNIDFIYERSAYFLFAGAFAAKYCNTPLIIEANEVVGIERARKLHMTFAALAIEKYSFKRSCSIIAVSSYLAKLIYHQDTNWNKIHVIPNAINPRDFDQNKKREEIRDRYGLTGKLVLGFAGWFDWWDRLDMLIDIQKELAEDGFGHVATMLIGHGAMAGELEKQIDGLDIQDKVILTGPVPKKEVLDYIDALDIGVLPHSNKFGSPMIMFEMMALGKCVIAPKLDPITDVINDMENGLLFEPLNSTDLKNKIISMIKDSHRRLSIGKMAREIILSKHTWDNTANDVLKSLNDTLTSKDNVNL